MASTDLHASRGQRRRLCLDASLYPAGLDFDCLDCQWQLQV